MKQSDPMLKFTISLVFSSALIIVQDGLKNRVFAACAISNKGIYDSIISKIESSGIASTKKLTCEQVMEINKNSPNNMLITSGRKRGRYTICLSDDSSNPCKYVIGTFNENKNPSDMLMQVFGIPKPKRTQLNETVERLFFKPSLLID